VVLNINFRVVTIRKIYKDYLLLFYMKEDISKNTTQRKNSLLFEKLGVYGGNYLVHFLGNTIKTEKGAINPDLGNPYAALGLGAWDILGKTTGFKGKLADRIVKLGGFAYFFGKSVYDLGSAVSGNYDNLVEFPFDASMAFTLGRDVGNNYNNSEKNPIKDFKDLKDHFHNLEGHLVYGVKNFGKGSFDWIKKNTGFFKKYQEPIDFNEL
jgi:hypothetical protein